MLAQEAELEPFANSPLALAAIDYIVSLSSNVFMPSQGGNMARTIQLRLLTFGRVPVMDL